MRSPEDSKSRWKIIMLKAETTIVINPLFARYSQIPIIHMHDNLVFATIALEDDM